MYVVGSIPNDSEHLQHYGVLGMKWGVRKNPARAYQKATKKKRRLENNLMKANRKVAKFEKKVSKGGIFGGNTLKNQKKLSDYRIRQAKAMNKAMKWTQSMEDIFKNIPVSELEMPIKKRGE